MPSSSHTREQQKALLRLSRDGRSTSKDGKTPNCTQRANAMLDLLPRTSIATLGTLLKQASMDLISSNYLLGVRSLRTITFTTTTLR